MKPSPSCSLLEWLSADPNELSRRYDRLYVPRNNGRFLQRNALVALGSTGGEEQLATVEEHADDPVLGDYAEWAARRIRDRVRPERAGGRGRES